MYSDNKYEFLQFKKQGKYNQLIREKGSYAIKKEQLTLEKTGVKSTYFPTKFKVLGECISGKSQKFNNGLELKADSVTFYSQSIYYDDVFGTILNDRNSPHKFLAEKNNWDKTLIKLKGENRKHVYSTASKFIPTTKKIIDFDSLRKLKVVILRGGKLDILLRIQFDKHLEAIKKFLRQYQINYFENQAYHTWQDIADACNGAHILIYAGHGNDWGSDPRSFGLTFDFGTHGKKTLKDDLKLHKNALVIFNFACFSAGSSESDTSDIGPDECLRRVTEYSKSFIRSENMVYFSSNYNSSTVFLLDYLFRGENMQKIFDSQAYYFTAHFELSSVYENFPSMKVITTSTTCLDKNDNFTRTYNLAMVSKPDYTIRRLLKE